MDDELLSNQANSTAFNNFLSLIGQKVRLKDFGGYKGGLDVRGDMTGQYSYYTKFEGHEIMYHVSTLLPFSTDDIQQVERKRHIGNDIVNIVFVDGTLQDLLRFNPLFIKSQFTHIYAAVSYQHDTSQYHLTVFSEKSVPLFSPSLPYQSGFSDHQEFRRFLLVKCINGEKATYNTDVFATKRERTYQLLLKDSLEQYGGGEESKPARDRMVLSEGLQDTARTYWKKDNSRKDIFVKVGQSLKLENMVCGYGKERRERKETQPGVSKPWQPVSVHTSLQIEIIAGDCWAGVGLLVVAREGGWILRQNGAPEKVFSLSPIVQINIMESLGIMVFRTEKVGKDQGLVYVYRLAELQTNSKILGREELREHGLEPSRGCSGYSVSNRNHSGLRLAIIVGRKILVYSWIHAEEWITFTDDTVQGFTQVQELTFLEQPLVVSLVERRMERKEAEVEGRSEGSMVVGTRKGFEMVDVSTGAREDILTIDCEPSDVQEIWEDEREELLVTHSCTSLFLRESGAGSWQVLREIQWNCQPNKVVPAFPYTLAFSPDSFEVRSTINGNLLQTLHLPKLSLIATKDDIFFTTTKMINNHRRHCDMEPMSKFCDPLYNIYKIPWVLLVRHARPVVSVDRTVLDSGPSSSSSGSPSCPLSAVSGPPSAGLPWTSQSFGTSP
ncbi:GTPase-activating Rap/Ran-GAP domain-like protein 3 [Eurytemora carolleeae]|uniref:GTPase-activating Rap/Ran-GAP domain-like protein 3 n=1 Tax=Eurytemora carolleeae TaxID=1294199 RepID=UPI000C77BE4A|nr:GTPase-activating Rap/Ran-GAP domain-like protein 3 [Eurytemora carolleeae]|eukprot:XP_023328571.1 GTPase-activating Rap/Ran-GAP domain-like protein 3 [Eurytemora affinis]